MTDYKTARKKLKYAVAYSEEGVCEYGETHEINCVLVGLTKSEAEKKAKQLKGKVTKEWLTPMLTKEELEWLNKQGIPAEVNSYGLVFKGLGMVFDPAPLTLGSVKDLYNFAKGREL